MEERLLHIVLEKSLMCGTNWVWKMCLKQWMYTNRGLMTVVNWILNYFKKIQLGDTRFSWFRQFKKIQQIRLVFLDSSSDLYWYSVFARKAGFGVVDGEPFSLLKWTCAVVLTLENVSSLHLKFIPYCFAELKDKFWWFCHMWRHEQPHKFTQSAKLERSLLQNYQFAKVTDMWSRHVLNIRCQAFA